MFLFSKYNNLKTTIYILGLKNIRNLMTTDRPYLLKISWVNESGIEFKSNYKYFC